MNLKFWQRKKPSPIRSITEIRLYETRKHARVSEPVLGVGTGYEYSPCFNQFCGWHHKDGRFVWKTYGWTLNEVTRDDGLKLKREYYKKYGDYGPARGRPENAAFINQMRSWV